MLPELDALDQRILGSLLEKQATVPASYPLSANALKAACNQTSNRDPLTDHADAVLLAGLKSLKERGLVRFVWAGKGSRVLKYHHLIDEVLTLGDDERALLTVLLLRGPQSAGELRTRTERLHAFQDKDAVTATLEKMASAEPPLVREAGTRRGQQEPRWIHLLGPVPQPGGPTPAESGVDRETVLAGGPAARDAAVVAAWDAVASDWADAHVDDLTRQPLDLWLLERLVHLAGSDPVLDLGCGPGHVGAFLADEGAHVHGLDISPAMITLAKETYSDLDFSVGDLRSLLRPRTAPAWGGVLAQQSLLHLAPSELSAAIAEMVRVLRPGGWLLLSVTVGDRVRPFTEFLGHPVDVTVLEHDPADILDAVTAAGLVDVEWYRRGAHPHEPGPDQFHVLARKP